MKVQIDGKNWQMNITKAFQSTKSNISQKLSVKRVNKSVSKEVIFFSFFRPHCAHHIGLPF